MKQVFYVFLKNYMKVLARFYFGKVELIGRDKIPVGKPIIYSCNHQNAFLDALLIGAFSPVRITSLTRSDVFGNHAGKWFMEALQMQPIYRMQDGIDNLAHNEKTFQTVRDRLRANEGVLIFSEGNHGNEYFLRPLSKGSSRMALESQEKMMDRDIQVVPVGINYIHHQRPAHKISIVFGEAIPVKDHLDEYQTHAARGTNQLKKEITDGMRSVLFLPDETEDYLEKRNLINRRNEGLSFPVYRDKIASGDTSLKPAGKHSSFLYYLGLSLGILNFLPLFLVDRICKKVKDIVFHNSFKWTAALFLFPIWWGLVFLIVSLIWGWPTGMIVFLVQLVGLFLRQYFIRWSNVRH